MLALAFRIRKPHSSHMTTATTTHLDGTTHTTTLRTRGARALRAAKRASLGVGIASVTVTTAKGAVTFVAGRAA
jgi:hypothetical protein